MIQSSSAESAACSKTFDDFWYCRDSAGDSCLVIVYKVCSQILFDFLKKVAQGMQLDCTSLELPKVRSESALAWSSKNWDLTLNAELMIDPALREISVCKLYLADPVILRGDTRVGLVWFVSLWAFYKCIQSKSAINAQYTSMESISTWSYILSAFTHWSSRHWVQTWWLNQHCERSLYVNYTSQIQLHWEVILDLFCVTEMWYSSCFGLVCKSMSFLQMYSIRVSNQCSVHKYGINFHMKLHS